MSTAFGFTLGVVLGALLGIALGYLYWVHRIDRCQTGCAKDFMRCSPLLHGGMDYCLHTRP